ncbi:MAG: HAD family phosphatase [Proteobacteria bacterium]|nr:HAD family phosphatase [Pseudomonadota bacterium]
MSNAFSVTRLTRFGGLPSSAAKPKTQALLFDLGGVLIDFDFSRAFRAWQPLSRLSLGEISEAFQFDAEYEKHERGEITAFEYFDHLRAMLALEHDYHRIAQGWNSIFIGEIPETLAMAQAARTQLTCSAFTNTNVTHQVHWSAQFPMVASSLDRVFASHQIGYRKPERQAFEHVARELGVPLGSIMFFDDLPENVQGAESAGLQAVLVRSPGDVRSALLGIGCAL